MTTRSKWFGVLVSVATIGSMAITSVATTAVHAASAHKTHTAKVVSRCKTQNKASGQIVFSDWQFPSNLNGYQNSEAVASLNENVMFDGLTYYDQSAKLHPDMLTVLPTIGNHLISKDGKTITLKLKKHMLWSNGQEMISADIKFGLAIGKNKLTGPVCQGSCDVVTRIDTPNKYLAILHLKKSYAPAIPNGLPPIFPVVWHSSSGGWSKGNVTAAATLISQTPTYNYENDTYPTNGPYQVASFSKDDRITYKPMKYYDILTCGGYVKNLIFAFYSSKPGMIAAAASKETDITQDYTLFDLAELRKHTSAFTLHNDPALQIEHLEFLQDKTYHGAPNPMSVLKVRQAVALAIDKQGMIRSALGVSKADAKGKEANTFFINAPGITQPFADKQITGQWDPIAKKYVEPGTAAAVKDAKKLLSQTTYKAGFNLDFKTTSGNPVRAAQEAVIANNLKANLNITVNPTFVPAGTFFDTIWANNGTTQHGDFQIGMWAFVDTTVDPDASKYNLQSQFIDRLQTTHNPINANSAGIKDKGIDKAFNVAAYTFNSSVRKKNYYFVQVQINKMAYLYPLYYRPQIATSDSKVKNFKNTAVGVATWNSFEWKNK
jgi:peptide/nickel transport system substrate-binding protein